jgi:RecA-family ATPase
MEKWAESCERPRLLVIDTLAKMRPIESYQTKQMGIYERDYAFMEFFHKIAHKHGIAIILVHHERKMESDDPFDRGSGSAALGGAADCQWILSRKDRAEDQAVLSVSGRDQESCDYAMVFDKEKGLWNCAGTSSEVQMSQTAAKVIDAMRELGKPVTPAEVASCCGITRNTVQITMSRLVKREIIQRSTAGMGRYSIIDKTNPFLKEEM